MADKPVKVGIIGCGNISGIYLRTVCDVFRNIELAACADLDMDRASACAEEHGCRALTVDELLAASGSAQSRDECFVTMSFAREV